LIRKFDPGEANYWLYFVSKVLVVTFLREFFPALKKALEALMGEGVMAGFPVLDVGRLIIRWCVSRCGFHLLIAFEIAAKRLAFVNPIPKAGPQFN